MPLSNLPRGIVRCNFLFREHVCGGHVLFGNVYRFSGALQGQDLRDEQWSMNLYLPELAKRMLR